MSVSRFMLMYDKLLFRWSVVWYR